MRYRLIVHHRATDLVGGLVEIPENRLPRVLALAGIVRSNDPGEYPLADEQIGEIAGSIGFRPDVSRFIAARPARCSGRGHRDLWIKR
jgi:hypothetical protein